ncbi:MAG: DNA-binding protein Alba [Candidatus Aenigmarchaeota archaeon]|nr:DNA-binding protein Alba [Candidatus Aenigmarchaeota archaeon]
MAEKAEAQKDAKREAKQPEKKRARADDNVVFVGKKPTMSYVLAVITQFSSGVKEVHLKARGKSISRAVDVAEVVGNRFVNDLNKKIDIGTEKIHGERDGDLNVSTIQITLSK